MNKMSRRAWGRRVLAVGGQLGLSSVALPGRVLSTGVMPGAAALAGLMTDAAYAAQCDEHVSNLVVGTGYGGAVTALRLARAGQPVTMLEMGRLWNTPGKDGNVFCKPFSPDERAMWFKDRISAVFSTIGGVIPVSSLLKVPVAAGILDVVSSPNMDVYLGRGVGGGSLVNLAMLITPYRETLQRILPAGIDINELYNVYYPRARATLGANKIRPSYFQNSAYHRYARVACTQAARAGFQWRTLDSGYDMAYMEQEEAGLVPKSALGAEGGFGNNHGKKSLDKTYLAEALGTGLVRIQPLTEVTSVTQAPDGRYVVTTKQIDVLGNVLANKVISCDRLFLAGGSMGSTQLLVKARETGTLPKLNEHIGTRWSSNGEIFMVRNVYTPTGSKASVLPVTGIDAYDHRDQQVYAMNIAIPLGIDLFSTAHITMTQTPELGRFAYDAQSQQSVLQWSASAKEEPIRSARAVYDKVNRANWSTYSRSWFGGKIVGDNATYHPLGGCPIGLATDDVGQVRNYPGLYVMDAALFPDSLVANPALSVTAFAERNIERIIARM
ncbi:GMC oxidoreductase [Aquabacterium sp. A3]|uniref:GMC oxidoreductase n=1 Tax=Aquabacterium sp. A3 TaxID=3132829 RepID=UPI003119BDC4